MRWEQLVSGGGEGARSGRETIRVGAGFALGLVGLGGSEKQGRVDGGNGPACIKSNGDIVGRDSIRKFGDGEDIIGVLREEGVHKTSAERLDGGANGAEWVHRIFHEGMPGRTGKADLVRKSTHGISSFWGKGLLRFSEYARGRWRSQEEKK